MLCSPLPGFAALLFLLPAMARHPALAARLTRFLARPLVRGPFLMRGLAALAGNLALLASIHRCKSTILFGHHALLAYTSSRGAREYSGCNRCATSLAVTLSNKSTYGKHFPCRAPGALKEGKPFRLDGNCSRFSSLTVGNRAAAQLWATEINCSAAARRARVRSRPSSASTSNRPGLAVLPVTATRTA